MYPRISDLHCCGICYDDVTRVRAKQSLSPRLMGKKSGLHILLDRSFTGSKGKRNLVHQKIKVHISSTKSKFTNTSK